MAAPRAKLNRPLAVKMATGVTNNKSRTEKTNSGTGEPSTSAPVSDRGYECTCGKVYTSKANLARHQKVCGENQRRKCQWCSLNFPTFPGLRQHERRAHPEQYAKELEQRLPMTESDLMSKLAQVEAANISGVFLKEMAAVTGLTVHQIRTRRSKPEYSKYLVNARKALASRSIFKQPIPPVHSGGVAGPSNTRGPPRTINSVARAPSVASTSRTSPRLTRSVAARLASVKRGSVGEVTKAGPNTQSSPSPNIGAKSRPKTNSDSDKTALANLESDSSKLQEHENLSPLRPKTQTWVRAEGARPKVNLPPEVGATGPSNILDTIAAANPTKPITISNPPELEQPARVSTQATGRRLSVSLTDVTRSDGYHTSESEELVPCAVSMESFLESHLVSLPHSEALEFKAVYASLREPAQMAQTHLDNWLCTIFAVTRSSSSRMGRRSARGGKTKSSQVPDHHVAAQQQRPHNYGLTTTGSSQRSQNYKLYQDLYDKNRSGLADKILSGKHPSRSTVLPSLEDVEDLFGGILESPSPPDDAPFVRTPLVGDNASLLHPFEADEVRRAKIGWGNSASGPDKVSVSAVKSADEHKLAVLFNIIVMRNLQPTSWRETTTTLVPKEGDLARAENWRPIAVGSALQRLLHRCLVRRITSQINLSEHQRGFVKTDGTLANVLVLDQYIRTRTEQGKPYNVVALDVRKAFDTVSHASIKRALDKFSLPAPLRTYIMSTFDTTTTIKVGGAHTRPLRISRGVRQGDPLSPLLFNMVVDELLNDLNSNYKGGSLPLGASCAAMGFADDLIAISDHELEMPLILKDIERFFGMKGLSVHPEKCKALAAGAVGGVSVARSRVSWRICGTLIPPIGTIDAFKYLGHAVGTTGVMKPSLFNLTQWLDRVRKAPLKPHQKLAVVKTYVIPRLLYGLQTPKITNKALRDADRMIRKHVRAILHLNAHTPDALIHASVRDGGLGVQELRTTIPRIFLSRLCKLLENSNSGVLSCILQSDNTRLLMERLERMAGDLPGSAKWRALIKSSPLTRGLEQVAENPASRSWIDQKPVGWTGRDFVRAVQLRTANLPTRAIPSAPVDQRRCRGGCPVDEALSHVLQTCSVTHWERIRRHDEIVRKVASHCKQRGWVVEEEPNVRHHDSKQLFKPDLAVHQRDGVIVIVDVQVAWEATELRVPYERKRRKYDVPRFHAAARLRWPGKSLRFAPVIIGARGVWPRLNDERSGILQFTPAVRRSCVNSALKWGSTIHRAFSKAVWNGTNGAPRPANIRPDDAR